MESHEGEVTACLDGTNLGTVIEKLEVLKRSLIVSLLSRPLKGGGPGEITEPVADEVCVTLELYQLCS